MPVPPEPASTYLAIQSTSLIANLQEAVEAVVGILGMAACDGTDAVPPNARSHTVCLAGILLGGARALVRISFGIDAMRSVAMKLAVRAEPPDISEAIHQIIQEA